MRILLFPDEQGSAGTGTPSSPQTPDFAKMIEGLLNKHGDPNAALRVLLNENHDLRDRVRDLKGKVPDEKAVVLTGDDAARWTAYSALGDPKDLKKALKGAEDATAEADRLRKADTYRTAAELHGLKPSVLVREAQHDGLDIIFEDVKEGKEKDAKVVRTAFVKGDADSQTPLLTYAETHWPDLMPALKAGGEQANGQPRKPNGTPPRREGPPIPEPTASSEETIKADLYHGGFANF